MSNASTQDTNRLDRRKARTRAALVQAAQTLIAEGRTNVPVLEITQAADVGMGSFYNHFETKEQLFEAAVEAVMDAYGQLLDNLTADIADPAEVFACSFRLTGRLHRREPELSQVLLNNVLRLLGADNGLAPRVRRDIAAAACLAQRRRYGRHAPCPVIDRCPEHGRTQHPAEVLGHGDVQGVLGMAALHAAPPVAAGSA